MMRKLMPVLAVLLLAGCGSSGGHNSSSGHKVGAASCPGYQTQYGCQAHSPTFGLPPTNARLRPTALSPSATATVLMLDTVDTGTLAGLSPQAVAGYTSGHWPTFFSEINLYPQLRSIGRVVSINVTARFHGRCLDVEPGDAVPSQSANWVRADFISGFSRPCVYTSLSEMSAVRANLAGAGLHQCAATSTSNCFLLWDADWTDRDHLDAGYNCTQWANHYVGRNIDPSRCQAWFYRPNVTPPPPPPPPPPPLHPTFNQEFDSGFQRGFVVRWDQRHHRAVPKAHGLVFGPGFNPGFRVGWRAAR